MTGDSAPAVLVTGVAGNLGLRLIPQLPEFQIAGVDMSAPPPQIRSRFERIDLGRDDSIAQLARLLRETGTASVVHLAFVLDPLRTGILDRQRMWQINVAGTGRVMEAIAEVNRSGGSVSKFIFTSSVSAYGPNLPRPVREEDPLAAHTLTYAIHKRAADELVRSRWHSLGACSAYVLRPHIFCGPTVENYQVGAFRGTPGGKGRLAARMRRQGKRLPVVLPTGHRYLDNKFQFVHVDDVARLIKYILRIRETEPRLTVLNVAGRGEPLSVEECARISSAKIVRLPTQALCRLVVRLAWTLGISSVPPDAAPYLVGTYTMETSALREFLGENYEQVIQFTSRQALETCFTTPALVNRSTVAV